MPVENKPAEKPILELDRLAENGSGPGTDGEIAEVLEWMLEGASACPREVTLEQREKYFRNVGFLTIEGLLQHAQGRDFV